MLRRFALFPFLFVLYIILNLLAANLGQIDTSQAGLPLVVMSLVTAVGMMTLYGWTHDWHYAAYVILLNWAFFFIFGHLGNLLDGFVESNVQWPHYVLLTVWGLMVFLAVRRRFWQRLGGAQRVTPALNLVLILALASQVIVGLFSHNRYMPEIADLPESQYLPAWVGGLPSLNCSQRPDIYYIILDGYGRADVLDELYAVDTGEFLDFLRLRGFFVADQSHTNYTQTVFSIPAGLNFTYLESEPDGVSGLDYFHSIIAQNRLMHWLKGCGYRTVAIESGFYFTDHPQVDDYLTGGDRLDEFTSLLLSGSPFDLVDEWLFHEPVMNDYDAHRARVTFAFDQLKALPGIPGPKIVFVHILSPHPPFVFDASGKPLEPSGEYKIADGDDFVGDWQGYRESYAAQVGFVNTQMQAVLDTILRKSPEPPIIIVQGDHGPGGSLDWDAPENSCLWERAAILNAYYLPGKSVMDRLYPQISPVNTFRLILNAYFGADLGLLPDYTDFTSHRLPRQVIDITSMRDSKQNCPSQ